MMDKSWINKPRNTKDYLDGVANFVKLANEKASINGKIYCPCRKCFNRSLFVPEIVEEHLVWNGFLLGYTEWVLHGESLAGTSYEAHHSQDNQSNLGSTNVLDPIGQDAMREMVQDVFGFNFANLEQSSDDDDIENLGESSEATSHLQDEAYTDILGKDRYGRVRGYGIGVTPTQLFGVEAYIRKMGCGGVDSMEMQRFQDQRQSTLKAHEEQMRTMQINYESQIQTMQKNHEEQMEAMHNSCEAKLAGIQSQLDQVTFMLLRFSGSFNNPMAGLAHFGSNIHQVSPSSSNDERDIL